MTQAVRDGDEFGTVPKVAAYLGLDERAVRKAVRRGDLQTYPARTARGFARVRVLEVKAWAEAHGMKFGL